MLNLHHVTAEDDPFLYELYAQTRAEELAAFGWGRAEQDAFLRMQFEIQKRSYAQQYPSAAHYIVLLDDLPIGRIMTEETDEAVLLVDLSIVTVHQNQGIGTSLLLDLQRMARGVDKKVRLHVLQHNPACRLYARLGFRITGESVPYLAMEWQQQES
jgi:ribosomal protein S18 acetylase RimI-like enzyme